MDAKVLSAFTDKYTGKKYKKGDVIKNIPEKRFDEILEVGKLVEAVAPNGATPKKEEKK